MNNNPANTQYRILTRGAGRGPATAALTQHPPGSQASDGPAQVSTLSQATRRGRSEVKSLEMTSLKPTEFRLDAPSAHSVRLAADFTEWETQAVPLTRKDNGTWWIRLPLSPGRYTYRFLVDGEWRDDPKCAERVPNPFGTTNSVIEVS
jgi:1,4-alpha-glucan branching enzyme